MTTTPAAPRYSVADAALLLESYDAVPPDQLLSLDEQLRWRRLRRAQDRDDFVAARLLVRLLLIDGSPTPSALTGIRLRQVCAECDGAHGRPTVLDAPEVAVSWAHSGGAVAAVVGAAGPLGVDVERATTLAPELSRRITWHEWTRAEALVKAGMLDLAAAAARAERLQASEFGLVATDFTVETTTGPDVFGTVVAPTTAAAIPAETLV
ncbi:hypothetical protein HJ588_04185 [Flexivirga sp. ID2601S]|uniref:4'-phosphopantetheinyl transferase superfamily protein n=1 Tax=Flexivirga aerilata TaxID=1656889 RepID=A0A849AF66_9MICO|nr:hypothetical protein [Flexivirga aerilata]NNG38473.1 hypothetical protein [Flexivirga aerilata]